MITDVIERVSVWAIQWATLAVCGAVPVACSTTASAQKPPAFSVSSPDLGTGSFDAKFTLNGFGCSGANVSPSITWTTLPPGTKSLALQVHDGDLPNASGFWHWAVYDIPASAGGLPRGAGNAPTLLPAGAFGGNTDFFDTGVTNGNGNYGGPCPPPGEAPHHYVFTLYALGVPNIETAAGLPRTGSAGLFAFALTKGLGAAVLGKSTFTATFGR